MLLVVVDNMLMVGPLGAGKTLMARSVPSVLPTMTLEECLEVMAISSVAERLPTWTPLIRRRPLQLAPGLMEGEGPEPEGIDVGGEHDGVRVLGEVGQFAALVDPPQEQDGQQERQQRQAADNHWRHFHRPTFRPGPLSQLVDTAPAFCHFVPLAILTAPLQLLRGRSENIAT